MWIPESRCQTPGGNLAFFYVPIEQRRRPDQASQLLAIGDNAPVLAERNIRDILHVCLLQLVGDLLAPGAVGFKRPPPRQIDNLAVARPAVPSLLAVLD